LAKKNLRQLGKTVRHENERGKKGLQKRLGRKSFEKGVTGRVASRPTAAKLVQSIPPGRQGKDEGGRRRPYRYHFREDRKNGGCEGKSKKPWGDDIH